MGKWWNPFGKETVTIEGKYGTVKIIEKPPGGEKVVTKVNKSSQPERFDQLVNLCGGIEKLKDPGVQVGIRSSLLEQLKSEEAAMKRNTGPITIKDFPVNEWHKAASKSETLKLTSMLDCAGVMVLTEKGDRFAIHVNEIDSSKRRELAQKVFGNLVHNQLAYGDSVKESVVAAPIDQFSGALQFRQNGDELANEARRLGFNVHKFPTGGRQNIRFEEGRGGRISVADDAGTFYGDEVKTSHQFDNPNPSRVMGKRVAAVSAAAAIGYVAPAAASAALAVTGVYILAQQARYRNIR